MRSVRGPAAIAAAVLVADQWTKRWATSVLEDRTPIHLIDDLVRLTYTRNSGVAFGLGAGSHFPYWIFSLAAAIGIIALLLLRPDRPALQRVALGLVLGGAVGNLIDRVRFGEVVDFILVSWRQWQFPVFNVADSAVTVGVAIFALAWTGSPAKRDEASGPTLEAPEAPGPEVSSQ